MSTLCHYRGKEELPCTINPYYTSREAFAAAKFEKTKKFSEIRGGVAFIHTKRDENKPCLSFHYDKNGIGVYKKNNIMFVGFAFAYFTSLMLLVNGKGSHACYVTGFQGSKFCKEDAIREDVSDEIIELEDINVSTLSACEAASILAAMEDYVSNLLNPDSCIGYEEERQAELPKWNAMIDALKARATLVA